MKLTNLHKKVCIYYKRKLLQHISNRNTTTTTIKKLFVYISKLINKQLTMKLIIHTYPHDISNNHVPIFLWFFVTLLKFEINNSFKQH